MPPDHQSRELDLCTGQERLTKYEQEGLVPFVGKQSNHSNDDSLESVSPAFQSYRGVGSKMVLSKEYRYPPRLCESCLMTPSGRGARVQRNL